MYPEHKRTKIFKVFNLLNQKHSRAVSTDLCQKLKRVKKDTFPNKNVLNFYHPIRELDDEDIESDSDTDQDSDEFFPPETNPNAALKFRKDDTQKYIYEKVNFKIRYYGPFRNVWLISNKLLPSISLYIE